MRFHLHVLDKHAISHGIPYRVGPAVGVPGEHGGNMAEIPRRGDSTRYGHPGNF